MSWIAEWIAKRAFNKLLKKVKKAALDEDQIRNMGDLIRDKWEEKLEAWATKAKGTKNEYDDAAILLAQVIFKSSYLEKKRNGKN